MRLAFHTEVSMLRRFWAFYVVHCQRTHECAQTFALHAEDF